MFFSMAMPNTFTVSTLGSGYAVCDPRSALTQSIQRDIRLLDHIPPVVQLLLHQAAQRFRRQVTRFHVLDRGAGLVIC